VIRGPPLAIPLSHVVRLPPARAEEEAAIPSPRVIRGPPLAIPLSHVVRLPPAHAEEEAAVARREENANLT